MAEDVQPYAREVITLPVNIQAALFDQPLSDPELKDEIEEIHSWRQRTHGAIIGYAGSTRFTNYAFQALATVARSRKDSVKVVLFGSLLPDQLAYFADIDALVLPYVSYETYAAVLGNLKADILLAPLDKSRSSMSKAYNKYLEYSMGHAAGIFSDIYPYTEVVKNGTNGLTVKDQQKDWEDALIYLLDNPQIRTKLAESAHADVTRRFETSVIAPQFHELLMKIADSKKVD